MLEEKKTPKRLEKSKQERQIKKEIKWVKETKGTIKKQKYLKNK